MATAPTPARSAPLLAPNPALDRLRLLPKRVGGSFGTGERRARTTGAGMEFADYRPYQPGDDPRHIDPQLYQRFGTLNLRQFSASKQMMVIICLDATGSMAFDDGSKLQAARGLAALVAQVALTGGDALRIFALGATGLVASPLYSRRNDVVAALAWIAAVQAGGNGDLHSSLARAMQDWPQQALVVIASDFWSESNAKLLQDAAHSGREIWLAHILSAAERNPPIESDGTLAVTDAETGEEIILPASAARDYIGALAAWNDDLARQAAGFGGQCLALDTQDDLLPRLLAEAWLG